MSYVSKSVQSILTDVIRAEGSEYTNHPNDRGGPTKYGITLATLSAWRGIDCAADDVRDMKEIEARKIYEARYVNEPGFDKVMQYSQPIAIELIDTGVNMGPEVPATFLQRALNAFNLQASAYPDLLVDGRVGPKTLDALSAYIAARGGQGIEVMLKTLNCLQGARYIELAEQRAKNEDFVFGWIRMRIGL